MKQQIQNLYGFKPASEVNEALKNLPLGQLKGINTTDGMPIFSHKAMVVEGKVIDIPSKYYVLVQHEEAFRPIIEGLMLSGCQDFKFKLFSTFRKAWLEVYTTSISDGTSEIFLGFRVINSLNRSTTVNYGIKINQGQQYIEVVGYRKVCSNGMIIQVPIEKAEFVRAELKQEVTTLLKKGFSFRHMAGVMEKIANVQYVVEAMALMREPLNVMIKRAQQIKVENVEKLITSHFAERVVKKLIQRFNIGVETEGNSLWSLYNAITYEATHGEISIQNSQQMLKQATLILNDNLLSTGNVS